MLSSGAAGAGDGANELNRRARGPISQCILEEAHGGGGGPGPCTPELIASFLHDGGPVDLSVNTTGCSGTLGWNLYQVLGGGVLRRLASLGPGQTYGDVNLVLNEQRTYRGGALTGDCEEGTLSAPVTILHDDTAPPSIPGDVVAVLNGDRIQVSWDTPPDGDLKGFKVLAASQTGGPYTQTHSGVLSAMQDAHEFEVLGPATYYIVVKAVDAAGNQSAPSTEATVQVP